MCSVLVTCVVLDFKHFRHSPTIERPHFYHHPAYQMEALMVFILLIVVVNERASLPLPPNHKQEGLYNGFKSHHIIPNVTKTTKNQATRAENGHWQDADSCWVHLSSWCSEGCRCGNRLSDHLKHRHVRKACIQMLANDIKMSFGYWIKKKKKECLHWCDNAGAETWKWLFK